MLFNSYVYILCFLPVSLLVYFMLGRLQMHRLQRLSLIAASLIFYGYVTPVYLLVILGSVVANYGITRAMVRLREKKNLTRVIYLGGVFLNLAVLFYFKYYDFFISNINALLGLDLALIRVALPLGISFFTFQQVSYVIDAYREPETISTHRFTDYITFVVFYPQLVAGPIVLHNEVLPQFANRQNLHFRATNASEGLYIFAIGLFKKVLIADTFGKAVAWGYAAENLPTLSALSAAIVIFSYTMQIYFDFSGYCDMATGIARMYNIRLPLNFNSPYKAASIVEFWDRWHMTLTRFLRTYVYFPLGGSRRGKARTYLNILIVFLVSGLWHGANWTFVLWGLLHGVANAVTRLIKPVYERIWRPVRWLLTFVTVNLLWVFFRAESIAQAFQLLGRLFTATWTSLPKELADQFEWVEYNKLFSKLPGISTLHGIIPALFMWGFILISLVIVLRGRNISEQKFKPNLLTALVTILLLCWSVVSLSGVSEFLYFNF